MVKTRRVVDLASSLHKKRRACNVGGETSESLILRASNAGGETSDSLISGNMLGDYNQDIFTKLNDEVASDLSKSVVSIVLSNVDTVLFACSGIAIERRGYITRFLTSAGLVRALNGTRKGHGNSKIEVRHGGNEVHKGFLAEHDLDHNFAIVYIMIFLDVHLVLLKCAEEILPHSNVVAVGRDISGKVMARAVILIGDLSKSEDSEELARSTSNSEGWEGGPLFDFDGNFVGMSAILVMESIFFLPWRILIKRLGRTGTSLQKKKCIPHLKSSKAVRLGERPTEPFGDVFGQGIWKGLGTKISNIIQRNVVALASFNGETRFFACTGFFIKWNKSTTILTSASLIRTSGYENKIEENLRIEVYTDKQRLEGTLQHYSLHYNVALVSVKDYRPPPPAKIQLKYYMCSKVAAVGRCAKSGKLMAANGLLVDWTGTLDCKFLVRSSCKISKAGIGGPLVNFDGEVIGMNFYDKKIGTPFLLWKEIHKILEHFKDTVESTAVEAGNDSDPSHVPYWKMAGDRSVHPYRWPVSIECRRRCDDLGEDESEYEITSEDEDESEDELPPGCVGKYTYRNGKRLLYRSQMTHYPVC
ncbi:hypothetical protein ACP4OV_016702 [Aristida adscensionis]